MDTCSPAVTCENASEPPLKSPVLFHRRLSFENHRDEIRQSTLNPFDSLKERRNVKQKKISSDFCHQCSKRFASAYGLHCHLNMQHPRQSILCADCHIIFRSSRTLKSHRQRCHSSKIFTLPDYQHLSSYLVVAFSSNQFPLMCEDACEQGRLPLGQLTSKFFLCSICNLSFPCSRTLKYHSFKKHDRRDEELCQTLLNEIITRVEEECATMPDDIDSLNIILAQQASHFGLLQKHVAVEARRAKQNAYRQVYPRCAHRGRTCANLCFEYLVSYEPYIRNYSYQIAIVPKGSPFGQGSIVSKRSLNDPTSPKEASSPSSKRKMIKRMNSSLSDLSSTSSQSKKKSLSTIPSAKQPTEPAVKIKETKLVSVQSSASFTTSSRKSQSKSNGGFGTLSLSTSLTQKPLVSPPRSTKRRRSPMIVVEVERPRRKRRQQPVPSLSLTIKIEPSDTNEQENDEDEDETVAMNHQPAKQRQASSGSIEYVHVLSHDSQTAPAATSLNNIENLQSNSDDEEIIFCHLPTATKKPTSSSPKKTYPHSNKTPQTSDTDEQVRVRCKVCGDILEGRSRFSTHVLTMHGHLLNKKMPSTPQQQSQQTAVVR